MSSIQKNDNQSREDELKYTKDIYKTLSGDAFLLGIDSPSDVIDWVSTESTLLNLIVSNRPDGGLPVGRIVSLEGDSGSGKSLLVAHIIAATQKKGGIAVLIESEAAVSSDFMAAVGVDLERLIYITLDTVEDAFETVEKIIAKVKKDNPSKLLTICLDSLTALSTRKEKKSDFSKEGYGTEKAILTSIAFRKLVINIAKMRTLFVFTNQVRMNMDPMSYDEYVVPGGKSIQFYPSVRIQINQRAKIKAKRDGIDEVIGVYAGMLTKKNRMGPPFRRCNVPIYFDRGINDVESVFNEVTDKKYVFVPKDTSTCCIDFKYMAENGPDDFKSLYNEDDLKKIYDLAENDYKDLFKKYEIPKTKYDKLAMINFETNEPSFLAFSKDKWEQFYSVPEFRNFILTFLSNKMQLKYMRHGMDENSIKLEEKNNVKVEDES